MKYSFIVPVYNGEPYIKECIDSILAQTVNDFEIIIVDDGSTDGSSKICDDYASKNSCIKVFHNENGGVSAARNFGLENSSGQYISFVDCDDVISPLMLECSESFKNEYDVVVFKHTRTSKQELCYAFDNAKFEQGDKRSVLDKTIYDENDSGEYLYNTVSKIFRKEVIKEVRFCKGITIGEDKIFGFNAFMNSDKIYFCDRIMYYCRPHSGSVMHKYSKDYSRIAEKTIAEYERIIEDCTDDEKAHYSKMLSLKAVKIMHTIAVLELCNKGCPLSYRERKKIWNSTMAENASGKYFAKCDGNGLNSKDKFYLAAYNHSFFRINLMTKCKTAKMAEYAIYKIFNR